MSMSRGAILTRCSGNCSQRTPNKWYIPLLTEVMDNSESKSFEQGVKKIINNTPSLVSNPSPPSLPPSLHLSLPPSLPLSLSLPPSLPPPLTSSSVLGWLQGSLKVPWKVERDLKESKKKQKLTLIIYLSTSLGMSRLLAYSVLPHNSRTWRKGKKKWEKDRKINPNITS